MHVKRKELDAKNPLHDRKFERADKGLKYPAVARLSYYTKSLFPLYPGKQSVDKQLQSLPSKVPFSETY